MDASDTLLVVVDMQEKFSPHIRDWDTILENIVKLVKIAKILDIPVIHTEQYPKGLGPTVKKIRDLIDDSPIEKTSFSCMGDEDFAKKLDEAGRRDIILCGIESHVCVYLTSKDLIRQGYTVHIPFDAVSSRKKSDVDVSMHRLLQDGVKPATVEMIAFELVGSSGHERFKEISDIIK